MNFHFSLELTRVEPLLESVSLKSNILNLFNKATSVRQSSQFFYFKKQLAVKLLSKVFAQIVSHGAVFFIIQCSLKLVLYGTVAIFYPCNVFILGAVFLKIQ